jgi:hypothetical protein
MGRSGRRNKLKPVQSETRTTVNSTSKRQEVKSRLKENKILALVDLGLTPRDIANELDVSKDRVLKELAAMANDSSSDQALEIRAILERENNHQDAEKAELLEEKEKQERRQRSEQAYNDIASLEKFVERNEGEGALAIPSIRDEVYSILAEAKRVFPDTLNKNQLENFKEEIREKLAGSNNPAVKSFLDQVEDI